jgi:hypothetical protein
VSEAERDTFTYTLDFSGPGGETRRVETQPGATNVTLTLTPGEWTVHVDAWYEGSIFGDGEERFTVYGGRNTVPIHMSPLSGNSFLSAIDIEDFGSSFTIENTFTVNNAADWGGALGVISGGGVDKNYIINLGGDFDLDDISVGSFGTLATGIKVSLRGAAHTISLTAGTQGNLLRVNGGQTLILRNITLRGHSGNTTSLVYVYGSGASLFMKAGATIKDNTNTDSPYGGGVYVYNGDFTMKAGAKITGNISSPYDGGGVLVSGGGTFTMEGGEISGNRALRGGGVYVSGNGANFNKTGGGTIYGNDGNATDNTATDSNGGHAVFYYKDIYNLYYRDTTLEEDDDISTGTSTLPPSGTGFNWTKK